MSEDTEDSAKKVTTVPKIWRIGQRFNEALGRVNKTEFDNQFEKHIATAETISEQVKKVLERIETMLQPDPSVLSLGSVMPPDGTSKLEKLTECFSTAHSKFDFDSRLSKFLQMTVEVEKGLAAEERKAMQKINYYVIHKLRVHNDEKIASLAREQKKLELARVSMDAAKNKIRKAVKKEDVAKLEDVLKETTEAFESQAEIVKNLLDQYPAFQVYVRDRVIDFVKALHGYHASCASSLYKSLKDLKEELEKYQKINKLNFEYTNKKLQAS